MKAGGSNTSHDAERVVAVLGAGAAGVQSALELAEAGFRVHLIEQNDEVLTGTSNKTPGRAGLGYHYKDSETGTRYLDSTLAVLKLYPDCTLATPGDFADFMSTGYYVIMKHKDDLPEGQKQFASLFHPDEILGVYEGLRAHYAKKVQEDPSNKIFGDPQHFFRVFRGEELRRFGDRFDLGKVAAVVMTSEVLLDWPKLRERLISRLTAHPNITVHLSTRVDRFEYAGPQADGKSRFEVIKRVQPSVGDSQFTGDADDSSWSVVSGSGFISPTRCQDFSMTVDDVVNATWEDTERLSGGLGLSDRTQRRTNRVKAILTADLKGTPLEFMSSTFFCMGAHVMFSNMGDGIGKFTYAPVTNVAQTNDFTLPDELNRYLHGRVTEVEKGDLASRILAGVVAYLPAAKDVKPIQVDFGVIKTLGDVDIFDPNSRVHTRKDYGVEPEQIGVTLNECRKLLHFMPNGQAIRNIVSLNVGDERGLRAKPDDEGVVDLSQSVVKPARPHTPDEDRVRLAVKPKIRHFVERTIPNPKKVDLRRALQIYMERNFSAEQIIHEYHYLFPIIRNRYLTWLAFSRMFSKMASPITTERKEGNAWRFQQTARVTDSVELVAIVRNPYPLNSLLGSWPHKVYTPGDPVPEKGDQGDVFISIGASEQREASVECEYNAALELFEPKEIAVCEPSSVIRPSCSVRSCVGLLALGSLLVFLLSSVGGDSQQDYRVKRCIESFIALLCAFWAVREQSRRAPGSRNATLNALVAGGILADAKQSMSSARPGSPFVLH